MEHKKLNTGKIELAAPGHSAVDKNNPDEHVPLIVKVKKAGYVPEGFTIRTRINDYLFTADSSPDIILSHENNDDIESISQSSRSQMID